MKIVSLIIFSYLSLSPLLAGDEFSNKERTVIYTHSLDIIKEYEKLINEVGEYAVNDMEAARSISESFLELFVNRQVLVFNDLDPTHNLSPFYEAETYISNLLLWYPDGMYVNLNLEQAKAGSIIQHEKDIYSLDIFVPKKIEGNYLNRSKNNNTEELLFRIAFNSRVTGFGNFKIVGIRNTDVSLNPDFNKNLEEVNAEEVSDNDIYKIEEGIRAILSDYVNYIALLGSIEEIDADKVFYRESFSNLFENENVMVFNDLQPDPENTLISIEDYLKFLEEDYTDGINNVSLLVDSAIIGKPIKTEEGNYYSKIKVDKFFSGSYRGNTAFREMFPLNLKVRFEATGNAFSDFKIQTIDIEASDFFSETSAKDAFVLPAFEINTITRKGISIGFEAGYGYSAIDNENMREMSLAKDEHEWNYTMKYGLKASANIYYFVNDLIGIKSGIEYLTYDCTYSLNGTFQDDHLITSVNDPNQYEYYKVVTANYDSSMSVQTVSIPFEIILNTAKPGKFGVYFEGGISAGYNLSKSYKSSGSYAVSGDFSYDDQLDFISEAIIKQDYMGFYGEDEINRVGNLPVETYNISVYGSLGLSIPLGYFSNLKIGPEVYYGFTDLDPGKDFVDIFGNRIPGRSTLLKKYNLKISYVIKL